MLRFMIPWSAHGLVGVAVLAGTVIALNYTIQNMPEPKVMEFWHSPCQVLPQWRVGWTSNEWALTSKGNGWRADGNSVLEASICHGGKLHLGLDKEGPGSPIASIMLDGKLLVNITVEKSKVQEVDVPNGGRLQVGYFNDYYKSEVRYAVLENLRMNLIDCRRHVDVTTPTDDGTEYVNGFLTLYRAKPAVIHPCGAGNLTFQFSGALANGTFPRIRLIQDKKTLLEAEALADLEKRTYNIRVTANPVEVTLLNPYTREIANRNLVINYLKWNEQPAKNE